MLFDENGNIERLKFGGNVEYKVNLLIEVLFWGFFVFFFLNEINIFLFWGGGGFIKIKSCINKFGKV